MKTVLFILSLLITVTMQAQKIDTVHLADNTLQTKWLKAGKHSYFVFFEDSAGRKAGFNLWERNLAFEKLNGEDVIHVTQGWYRSDSLAKPIYDSVLRKVTSYVIKKNFQPVFHQTWHPRMGDQAFQFSSNAIKGVDTAVNSNNKDFNLALPEPMLNWELDLETFSTLPLAENKTFALPFYHPGSKSTPQFYLYKVTGSEMVTRPNGSKEDCWKLEISYASRNSATFYISKKTQEVVKMIELIGKNKRYKVKLV